MNWQLTGGSKLCSRPGFDKAFAAFTNPNLIPPSYTDWDFHDQGTTPGQVTQQYPTLLYEATDNSGNTYLYLGTQSGIWLLNTTTGYWTNLINNLGGTPEASLPQTRFKAATLQNVAVFTNNVDPPQWTTLGSSNVSTIPDLVTLQVTAAGLVIEFNGFLILMDVLTGGVRTTSRVQWSSLNCPLSWALNGNDCQGNATLAGWQDLDYGSRILAAIPMAGSIYIFTQTSVWVMFSNPTFNNSAPSTPQTVLPFAFAKVYSDPLNSNKCLAYPNAIVSTGQSCWYAASDGFYFFSPYIPEPVREEWLYRASTVVFNDNLSALDPSCCQSPIMGLYPDGNEIYFSWPEVANNVAGGCINTATLTIDYLYKSTDYQDAGFSAFANFRPSPADPESCPQAQLFLGAYCQDKCLKEIGGIYSRNVCTNASTAGGTGTLVNGVYVPATGQYTYVGYYQRLRGLLPLQNFDRDKFIRSFLLECTPAASSTNNVVHLRIGTTQSEADPNLPDGPCAVQWFAMPDIPLACGQTQAASKYTAQGLQPVPLFVWKMLQSGRFVYFEITIQSADGSPAIGANACLSRIECEVRLAVS